MNPGFRTLALFSILHLSLDKVLLWIGHVTYVPSGPRSNVSSSEAPSLTPKHGQAVPLGSCSPSHWIVKSLLRCLSLAPDRDHRSGSGWPHSLLSLFLVQCFQNCKLSVNVSKNECLLFSPHSIQGLKTQDELVSIHRSLQES